MLVSERLLSYSFGSLFSPDFFLRKRKKEKTVLNRENTLNETVGYSEVVLCEGPKRLTFEHFWQVADQQSAMFGECCFQTGDVKLTMGTGTFLDINTGSNPQQNVGGKSEYILFINKLSLLHI